MVKSFHVSILEFFYSNVSYVDDTLATFCIFSDLLFIKVRAAPHVTNKPTETLMALPPL